MSNAKAVGLAFLIIIVVFAGIIGEALIERENSPEPVSKPEYIYKDIVTKHGDSFRIQSNMFEEIKKSVATSKNIVVRKNIETKTEEICSDDEYKEERGKPLYLREIFYDKNGREVYRIDDKKTANRDGSIRGYKETPYYPNEIGYVYGSNGKIVKEFKSLLSSSTYTFMKNRKSMYRNTPVWDIETKEYEYDSNNLLTKERRIKFIYSVQSYESSEKEYESGKLKKEKIVIDDEYSASNTSLIYVEIAKEYDENEKLIKKFVLRKNKFNEVRSETNFDFIKDEIVTKYYDGEKEFATVTETLIGKDRAIVKRERVGDEFVIWDFVTYGKYGATMDKYFVNNNKIKYEIKNSKYSIQWSYNEDEKGINDLSYRYEMFVDIKMKEDEGARISNSGEIYEYSLNGNKVKIKRIKFDKTGEKIYYPDEVYIIEKDYIEKYKDKTNVIEEKELDKEKIIFGGKNGY